jgi:DNA polymerase IV
MSLHLPPIYLLSTNLAPHELHALEDQIPSLTWDIHEAEIILGKISKRERALFELRKLKLRTEEVRVCVSEDRHNDVEKGDDREGRDEPAPKRRRTSPPGASIPSNDSSGIVRVIRLSWLTDSLEAGERLPVENYVLYSGKKPPPVAKTNTHAQSQTQAPARNRQQMVSLSTTIRSSSERSKKESQRFRRKTPSLTHETTSEHDISLPLIPGFLQTTYSCQRPTPANPPNADFIEELKDVRTLRTLQGDQVGVRAYSTSIAALSAYPFPLATSGGM